MLERAHTPAINDCVVEMRGYEAILQGLTIIMTSNCTSGICLHHTSYPTDLSSGVCSI